MRYAGSLLFNTWLTAGVEGVRVWRFSDCSL